MADYIRRFVSGDKARFKDKHLDLDLDLVYVTDQVIIMGYPASGMEGLYRNRREDAKKFLDHRHGKNYWVFNFCPVKENSYPVSYFEGRVSRYPFPDHHAPPLALLPLVAREMRSWLSGSPHRVAVLHCKAGKGRSGTMACAYLLSLDDHLTDSLKRSHSGKERAKLRAEDVIDAMPDSSSSVSPENPLSDAYVGSLQSTGTPSTTPTSSGSTASLKSVLDLHTSRRMKAPSSDVKKQKQGVSIPSQRRWLYYWSLLLAHQAPSHVWCGLSPSRLLNTSQAKVPKVRLTQVTLRMKESSGVKTSLLKAANVVIDRAGLGKLGAGGAKAAGANHVWISLARYDDDLIESLEKWEEHSRSPDGQMGKRRPGSEHMGEESLDTFFNDGRWDSGKMVPSFAKMGAFGDGSVTKTNDRDNKVITFVLKPLSTAKWKNLQEEVNQDSRVDVPSLDEAGIPQSETTSICDVTQGVKEKGVVLDAAREIRLRLYMGQIFMGWMWFIPIFHMPPPPSTSDARDMPTVSTFRLTRKDLDFPLGIGSSILDVEVALEWLSESDAEAVQPFTRTSGEEEPLGVANTVQAIAAVDVEVKQAAED
ncbi:phosphatases II [Armillaria solidipes]|uniref:phosphatidylinositol-3,4,5-trisphosphate 3-phosphatase n=1 Tax=Armillaria solidipes TaxID=1076256 RepID=A0A2H3CHV9_9AGAR|nr:phosphatases II [Armillaria solidipes]